VLDFFIRLQDALLAFLDHSQYVGLTLYVFFEEAGVPWPIPAETAIVLMGYQVYLGVANPWFVVGITVGAATAGACVLYWVARLGGRRLLHRWGRFLHVTPSRLTRMEHWFDRYAAPAIIFGRLIPGFRIVVTLVAGVTRANFWVFLPSAALSALVWSLIYMSLGWGLGGEYERVVNTVRGDPRIGFGVAIGVIAVVAGWLLYRLRGRLFPRWFPRPAPNTSELDPKG